MTRYQLCFLKKKIKPVYLYTFSLLLLFQLAPVRDAAAGIRPNPMSEADTFLHYEDGASYVKMVEEDVVITVYDAEIRSTADFLMFNEGDSISIDVGFPYRFSGEFIGFRAYINGQEVDVRDELKKDRESNRITGLWKVWPVRFNKNEGCRIRIEYGTEPLYGLKPFNERVYSEILPADSLAELQRYATFASAEYSLKPSKAWKGTLARCRVSLELAGKTDEYIRVYGPDDGKSTGNGITWNYTDYEPSEDIMISYHPSMKVSEIKPYLLGFLDRYPDNPRIVNDAGNFLRSFFGAAGLQKEIFHSFFLKWNRPIPQLMLYAEGGKCRFNYKAEGYFYSAWMMARYLLLEYQRTEELDRAADIAPAILKITGAIVDSLDTCSDLPERDERLLERARELLDIAQSLVD